ncbi:MAG: ROK family protein [Bacteroidetes bacterium QH_8_67_23]|nr:MAG: ROK family protein [Bacteroidetes bacterium QH_8_67_23]
MSPPPYAIGIDLGGTYLRAALVERGKGFLEQVQVETEAEKGPDHVLDRVADLARRMMRAVPGNEVAGLGMGAPGAINWERTTLSHPPNLSGWTKVNVREALRERLGQPDLSVTLENDANVAALGSAFYSVGQPYDSFLMVTLGTGVGGAIIYRDRIFRGTTGAAGEFGHLSIDHEGPVARSGVAGAIEAYLGQRFLSRHARYRLLARETVLHERAGDDLEDLTPKMLFEAAEDGDEAAREIWTWAGHKLGCALGSAINLLDIRTVIVGGGVAAAGDYLLDPTRETMQRTVIAGLREELHLEREPLGNDVALLGAAQLAFQPDPGDTAGPGETAPAERAPAAS